MSHAAAVPSLSLPRLAHLRVAAQFQTVFREGRRLQGASFRLHVHLAANPVTAPPDSDVVADEVADATVPAAPAPPVAPIARLGITVSKRVDKHAVGRNRIRRQARECFRLLRPILPPGDYVVLALSEAARQDNAALREELLSLFERARTLKPRGAAVTMPPPDVPVRRPPTVS
jgi:ribonuclease P protein component